MHSQVWIDQGATWYYDWSGIGEGGFHKIEYTHDTIIQGLNWEILKTENHKFMNVMGGGVVYTGFTILPNRFTRMSGDTIYHLHNGQFEILYNFNAIIGESWDLGVDTSLFGCSSSIVNVTQLGTDTLNATLVDWLFLEVDSLSSEKITGKAWKRFGAESYLFPIPQNCNNSPVDLFTYSFRCFYDTSFTIYNNTLSSCDSPLDIDEIKNHLSFLIYPNPNSGNFQITNTPVSENLKLQVYNTLGEELYGLILPKWSQLQNINISNLNTGIYFAKLSSSTSSTSFKFFVK